MNPNTNIHAYSGCTVRLPTYTPPLRDASPIRRTYPIRTGGLRRLNRVFTPYFETAEGRGSGLGNIRETCTGGAEAPFPARGERSGLRVPVQGQAPLPFSLTPDMFEGAVAEVECLHGGLGFFLEHQRIGLPLESAVVHSQPAQSDQKRHD